MGSEKDSVNEEACKEMPIDSSDTEVTRQNLLELSQLIKENKYSQSALETQDKLKTKDSIDTLRKFVVECPELSRDRTILLASLETLSSAVETNEKDKDRGHEESCADSHSPTPSLPHGGEDDGTPDDHLFSFSFPSSPESCKRTSKNQEDSKVSRRLDDEGAFSPTRKQARSFVSKLGVLVRAMLLDLPLALLFIVFVALASLHHIYDEYLEPQLLAMKWTPKRMLDEVTYYHRFCDKSDISTLNVEDLRILPDYTTDDAVEHMLTHGMSVYSDILTDETADALRSYIIDRNSKLTSAEFIDVIENSNRYSFGIGANDDPIVPVALREIATNPVLLPAVEQIMGKNPAVIEMTAITSTYGAKDQFWHADVIPYGSAVKYSRTFVPSYSLFIPLQDTTDEMGATNVCPGTHMCANNDEEVPFCVEYGFPASGDGVWKKGTGILMNQQSYHRGSAYVDPNGSPRVVFILTFAPRPRPRVESRQLSMGGSYSVRWDMWGHTMNDLRDTPTAMSQPWAALRSLGIYKPPNSDWGWDFITVQSSRISNEDTGYLREDLDIFLENGGFGLPDFLNGKVTEDESWHEYLLDTLKRCKYWAGVVNAAVLIVYITAVAMTNLMQWLFGKTKRESSRFSLLSRALFRLTLTHGMIIFIAYLLLYRVAQSLWAKDIKSGRLRQSPFPVPSTAPGKVSSGKYHTFPDRNDVLIGTRFDSDFLASYNRWLDYHPGNKVWRAMIKEYADVFSSYDALPPLFQQEIAASIVKKVESIPGRFLLQDDAGEWVVLSPWDSRRYTSKALILEGNVLLGKMYRENKLIVSVCKYGLMRDSALCRRFTPNLMESLLQKKILLDHMTFDRNKMARLVDLKDSQYSVSYRTLLSATRELSMKEKVSHRNKRAVRFLKEDDTVDRAMNFQWLQEGDAVEGRYRCEDDVWFKGTLKRVRSTGSFDMVYDDGEKDYGLPLECIRKFVPFREEVAVDSHDRDKDINQDRAMRTEDERFEKGDVVEGRYRCEFNEWYKGKVKRVHSTGRYDVAYDDGEEDYDLSLECVRKFVPFREGEVVDAQYGEDDATWYRAVLTDIMDDGTYSVLFDDGDTLDDVPSTRVRRFDVDVFAEGDTIETMFDGEWYSGTISQVNNDGTYDVDYDDGDQDFGLSASLIRRA